VIDVGEDHIKGLYMVGHHLRKATGPPDTVTQPTIVILSFVYRFSMSYRSLLNTPQSFLSCQSLYDHT